MYQQQPPYRQPVRPPVRRRRDMSPRTVVLLASGVGLAVLVFGVIVLIVDPKAFRQPADGSSSAPAASPSPSASASNPTSARVTKAQYGDRWPFVHITAGTVRCIPRDGAPGEVIFVPDGGQPFALNGTALDAGVRDVPPGEWRKDPAIPGASIDIAPLRDPVAKACGL